jgi:Na+/melibiose symporter-like transporter
LFSAAGGEKTQMGYFWAVGFCVLLGLPTLIWSSVKVKERVQPPPDQTSIPLGKQFASFFKNKYIILAFTASIVNGFNAYGRMGMLMYYFTYYANNQSLMSIQGIVGLIFGILGAGFLGTFIFQRVHSKGRTMIICMGGSAVGFAALFFLDPNKIAFWIVAAITQFAQGGTSGTGYALIPDAIDFGEYKTGVRCDGFLAAFVSFGLKAGGAIGPAVLLAAIGYFGYVPNIAQNASVLTALRVSISIVPGICCLLVALLYAAWDMNDEKHDEIRRELERRRS